MPAYGYNRLATRRQSVVFGICSGARHRRHPVWSVGHQNIGTAPIEAILRARAEGGPFKDIQDFATRVSAREVNRKVWESLAKCGAFDSIGGVDRATLLHNLELITSYAAKSQKKCPVWSN
ncbi:hypothetical protein IPG36_06045 [bacterium]|nr:MAG: hypothetical protein IPG36_06045 [bacterium]